MTRPAAGPAEKSEVFKTADGATLVGRLFHPDGPPRAVMVLNGAIAVQQDYYRHFAAYAAQEHGVVVFTYDYRDMGRSASGPMRLARSTMSDWGLADQEAARAKVRRLFPGLPLWIMGHSLGGMTMTMQTDREDIERLTCVASGNVHYSDHPWPYRAKALMFWFGLAPLLTRAAGYLPGRHLGLGDDMPASAYWQWRRWCSSMQTFGGDEGHIMPRPDWPASGPRLRILAFADDEVIPPHSVARLARDYDRGQQDVEIFSPKDLGLSAIGHFGAFARRNAAVWNHLMA